MHRDDDGDSLSAAFWAVARHLRHTSAESLAPWEITPSQSRALMMLFRGGPMRPGALATALRIAPRSATEVIDHLEQRGFVERHPDPDDRRATLVEVTDPGRKVVKALRAARGAEFDALFAERLTAEEQATLRTILAKLRDA